MKKILAMLLMAGLGALVSIPRDLDARQKKAIEAPKVDEPKKEAPKKEAPKLSEAEELRKSDVEILKKAGYTDTVESMTDFFKKHTVTEEDKGKIQGIIKSFGDDSFDNREKASSEIVRFGVSAIALLRTSSRDVDPEIARRSDRALEVIEQVPTSSIGVSAARLLASEKDSSIVDVLLKYVAVSDDEAVVEEIRSTFAALSVADGKMNKTLEGLLSDKDTKRRALGAEAFARSKDKDIRAKMREFAKTETSGDIKMLIALGIINVGRDKDYVPEMIKLLSECTLTNAYAAEDILGRLAGEDAPQVAVSADKANTEKTRDEWKKWWDANEKKVDMAKIDADAVFNLTIVCESPMRGGLGRIVALGADGKERWSVKNLNWPMDALPVTGKRVVIAEHNRNRIVERDIDPNGKEHWSETMNQPCNVGKTNTGAIWAVGRNQIIEWEKGDKSGKKQAFTFTRNEYDIVAGQRMKNGDFVILTQNAGILIVDRAKGQVSKTHAFGGGNVNYYAGIDLAPDGKSVYAPTLNTVEQIDLATGKSLWQANFQQAYSVSRLRNGNVMVATQVGTPGVFELDNKGKKTGFEYKGDNAYRPLRAVRR